MVIVKHDIVFHVSSSAIQDIILFLGKCQSITRGPLLRRGEGKSKMGGETEKQREEEGREKGAHQHFDSKH